MKKSVFLVKTPLQLLNAMEAKYYFDLDKSDCVLIIMGDRKSQPQLLKLADVTNEWGDVVVLNNVNLLFGDALETSEKMLFFKKSFFNVLRLNRISKRLIKVEYIFVGYAKYIYMKHFVNVMPHEKVFFLDDGNATIELAKERRQARVSNQKLGFKKELKLYGKRFFQGVKDKSISDFNFFTMYDIVPAKNDRIIKNNFNHLRDNVDLLQNTDDIYFIGSPLSECGFISQEGYYSYMSKVQAYFSGKRILYIAHRRESPNKLAEIENKLNLKVVLFDYPIEYQLAYIGPRPKVLASFMSSALDSCRIIFGKKLKIISFRMDLEESPLRDEIESIYDSYTAVINDNFIVESDY